MILGRAWHVIPEVTSFEGGDDLSFAIELGSAIVLFAAKVGVIPQIEMVDEMVSASAKGVTVSVDQDEDSDDSVIEGRLSGAASRHLARNLVSCLTTLEGMLELRSANVEACE